MRRIPSELGLGARIPQIPSMQDMLNTMSEEFVRASQPAVRGANTVANAIGIFAYMINSNKGRDKMLSVFQYLASLYRNCMIDFMTKNQVKVLPLSA